jgi:hypothetical protein
MTIAMSLIYIAIGIMFLFTNVFYHAISQNRQVIGAVFLAYGCFRLITGIVKLKKSRLDSDNE